MRAELLRKEKELIDIKRKLLDVQIAEARGQMNTVCETSFQPYILSMIVKKCMQSFKHGM